MHEPGPDHDPDIHGRGYVIALGFATAIVGCLCAILAISRLF